MEAVEALGLEHSGEEKHELSRNERSFQLGLSDSSFLQCQAQALAMESTQAFVTVDTSLNLEHTQAYAVNINADRTSAENAAHLEATQAYGEGEEHARCSVLLEKEGQVDFALEATQAYISEPHVDSEDETNKDERTNATGDTQPLGFSTSSSLAMAETQLMSAFEEEESLHVEQVKFRTQDETMEMEESGDVSQPQQALFIADTQPLHTAAADDDESSVEHLIPQMLQNSEFSAVETQPMDTVEHGESDDEESMPGPRKRKAKPLQLEEELTQPLTNSEFSVVETQPMHISVAETQPMSTNGNEESDVEDIILGLKGKCMQVEEDRTQTLTNSELSAVETQPVDTLADGENDEEDLIPAYRRRGAKPLLVEEDTQPLPQSEVCGAQPMTDACEDKESSDEDLIPNPQKRKSKPLQLEEEEAQAPSCSVVSVIENQPIGMGENEESSDDESVPGPRKRRAKALQLEETQSLTNSEVSAIEIPLETKTFIHPERVSERKPEAGTSGVAVRNKRGQKFKDKEEQAKSSDPPKRQTRGNDKALPANKGKRGKSRSAEDEGDEEEAGQPQRTRGKASNRQQKDKKDEEQLESEINEHAENNNILKETTEDVTKLRHPDGEKTENKGRSGEREQMEWKRKGQNQEINEKELLAKNAETARFEEERAETDRREKEEKNRRTDNEKMERLELENAKRKADEKLKTEEKERKGQKEKERLETEMRELEEKHERERKEQENQAKLEREERERLEKENQIKEQQEKKVTVPTRGRRAARRTLAIELEQDSTNDVPARRTRSRSNSSNSVSSERSASSSNTQESRGRGRGRGVNRTSEPPQTPITRSSNRRRTVAAETSQHDNSPQGLRSRSNSSNSLNSEVSSCSVSSQVRGRGGSHRGRGRKTDVGPDYGASVKSASDQISTPKPAARGRRCRRTESSNEVFQEDKEKADSEQAATTRGQQQASSKDSEPASESKDNQSAQEGGHLSEESPLPKRNVRGRGQQAVKNKNPETQGAPAVSDGDEAKGKKTGRKRELTENEDDSGSSSKIFKANNKVQTTEATEENGNDLFKNENPVQARRRGRASSAQAKKKSKESPPKHETKQESEEVEGETLKKRATSQSSVVQTKRELDDCSGSSSNSMSQDANVTPQVT